MKVLPFVRDVEDEEHYAKMLESHIVFLYEDALVGILEAIDENQALLRARTDDKGLTFWEECYENERTLQAVRVRAKAVHAYLSTLVKDAGKRRVRIARERFEGKVRRQLHRAPQQDT